MQFSFIKWINNTPYSIEFNDIYFSTEGGPQEAEYVCINQNQLKERFSGLKYKTFTIIETGFGTGLNFYCTAINFLAFAPPDATLHYISIEKFPLAPSDMQKIADFWPQFNEVSRELIEKYVDLKPHLNTINIANRRIFTELQVDDILSALPHITQKADAWFLDGFAPAKNTEMWSDTVFNHIARLSKAGTTFATFTSASAVRRGLQEAGFEVQKCTGFGKKREMLSGVFVGTHD